MYLFGASGHGKVIIDSIQSDTKSESLVAVYDDNPKEEKLLGIPVLKTDDKIEDTQERWIIGVGNNAIRKNIAQKIKGLFLKAIHPSAVISTLAQIGEGTVIMANAVVNSEAQIGKHCIINTGAVVEHDCIFEDFVHISPNASIAGAVTIGEGTHIGIGASVIQCITIGKWCTIGAGAVIIDNVPDYAVVVGNPGRIIKYNQK